MPVSQPNTQYNDNLPIWQAVRDCVAGQMAIKKAGSKYLPEFKDKDQARYDAYKMRAVFFGVTQRTLSTLLGAAMRKPPEIVLPSGVEYLKEDIDGSNRNINQLFASAISNDVAVGRHGLLVDYPSADGELTLADVKAMNLRPEIKEYSAENIINWKTDAGKLTLVVLQELVEDAEDEFTSTYNKRFRVLRLIDGIYHQEIYDDSDALIEGPIAPSKSDGSKWDFIPFVFPGSMNNTPDVDFAPMYDLSVVNIAHYRNSADYEEGVFIHGQATLHIDTGTMTADAWDRLNPSGNVEVGSRRGIITQGGGSSSLLQAQANSAANEAMTHKEKQMVNLGARLIETGGANQTATAVLDESAAEHSVLSMVINNVGEAIEQCLKWCCEFAGANPDEVSVTMNLEFFDRPVDAQMIVAMMGLEDRGHITQTDIRTVLRKSGTIEQSRTDEEIDAEVGENGGTGSDDIE